MRNKLLIVGSGGFGRVTLEHAMNSFDCSFVDDGYTIGTEICGATVVGNTTQLKELHKEFPNLVIGIGNNKVRESIYVKAKAVGYNLPNIIGENVYISPFAEVGDGCVILNNVVIQNGSKVGNGNILNPGVEIHHDSIIGHYNCIYTNSVVRTYAVVGNRVKIGSNVTISNEAIVNDDEIIEDGAVRKP